MATTLTIRVSTRRRFTVPSLLCVAEQPRGFILAGRLGKRHSFSHSTWASGTGLAPLQGRRTDLQGARSERHEHDPARHPDSLAAWRAAYVAVQLRLGLLPQRWAGAHPDHPDHPGRRRTALRPGRPGRGERLPRTSAVHAFRVVRISGCTKALATRRSPSSSTAAAPSRTSRRRAPHRIAGGTRA